MFADFEATALLRPALRFDAIVLPGPPGWLGWGQLRVTALNHSLFPADLKRICRSLRLGGRIVSMVEASEFDEATQTIRWSSVPKSGNMRCSPISEYHLPAANGDKPGSASFDVLIRPGRGLSKLGYTVEWVWSDAPHDLQKGRAYP